MRKTNIWRSYLICFIILTVIFAVLYHPFIFGGAIFAFDDVGGDTIHQYLPMAEYELELITQGKDNTYSLQFGLGGYKEGLLAKYLFPARLVLLLFGPENVHIGVIVRAFLLYAVICLFSLLFFRRLYKNEKVACVCALLWTFTSYAVLWGQHYSFLINLTVFTVALYGFQLYLEEDRRWYLMIPAMALLIGFSYYITYMSCYFFLIYGVLYLSFQKKKFWYILKRIGVFIPLMILAACMAGVYILPSVLSLFQSARLETNVGTAIGSIPKLHPRVTILNFLIRLVNTNLLGVGNLFNGTPNYYECAILSVSLLFFFSFIYMLQTKYWKRVLILTGLCALALCSPLTSHLLQFASHSQRWTFMLSFAQVLLIGFAMTHIAQNHTVVGARRRYLITVLVVDALLLGFCYYLYNQRMQLLIWCDVGTINCVCLILLIYHIAFFFLWKTKFGYWALVSAMILELILGNYPTLNERALVSLSVWNSTYANDGTKQVVEQIQQQDDSLYRINKTYTSLSFNDPLVQDYNGMSLYHSTASSHLLNLSCSFGYEDTVSRVNFSNNTIMENSLLGVKYVITKDDTEMDADHYTQIYNDGTFRVYRNDYALGFGYLYQEQMQQADFKALPADAATKLLSRYYYITGSDDAPSIGQVQIDDMQLRQNLAMLQQSCITDLTQDGNTFRGTVNSPYGNTAMLCLPLIYSQNWVATVDGQEADVININGGLVGISVPAGEHDIQISYVSNTYTLGVWCSVIGIAGYAALLLIIHKKKKREA